MQNYLRQLRLIPLFFALLLLSVSCAPAKQSTTSAAAHGAKQAAAEQNGQTVTGNIKGISNLA